MIEQIVVVSLIVFAIYATMEEGMIFGFVRKWWAKLTKNWKEEKADYLAKPIFDCPVCMAAWHGSAAYWIIYGNDWKEWLIVVICAIGLNEILTKLFPDKD